MLAFSVVVRNVVADFKLGLFQTGEMTAIDQFELGGHLLHFRVAG